MGKPFGADFQVACPKCKGIMRVRRRTPHPARQACEKQTIECANCAYATTRIVDADGRELRKADISPVCWRADPQNARERRFSWRSLSKAGRL
jgi:hypothetical protein